VTAPLVVRFVHSAADIPAELWDACFPPPLEGRWWYETLEGSALEDQFTFFYALIEADGKPAGIAPLFLMTVPLGVAVPDWLKPFLSVPARTLPFLADPRTIFVGSPCADEGTVGLLPDVDRRAALLCLQDALEAEAARRDAAMIVWKDFAAPAAADLAWLAAERRLFPLVGYPGTHIELPAANKDAYFAALKGSRRAELRRKLRRSVERAALDTEIVQKPDQETLDAIHGLFRQTFDKSPTKFERLGRRFFELIAENPVSYFVLLRERESGELVAFKLCFALRHRVIHKFIGLDYSRPRDWMLYFRLWDAALEWSLARGATSIQSGQTGYAAKLEVGHRLLPLTNYCRHRNRLLHGVFAFFARFIGWKTLDDDLARFLKAHPEADAGAPPRI
jgi:Acetyltransferase (GNAT) domain